MCYIPKVIKECVLCIAPSVHARKMTSHQMKAKQVEAAKRWHTEGAVKKASGSGVQNITFSNPEASKFWVDGSAIPEVDFDIGPSWSGLLPISNRTGETRQVHIMIMPVMIERSLPLD